MDLDPHMQTPQTLQNKRSGANTTGKVGVFEKFYLVALRKENKHVLTQISSVIGQCGYYYIVEAAIGPDLIHIQKLLRCQQ